MVNRLLAGQAEASQETNNGGQERDQEAVSETSQERRQGSDKTGQQASKETNDDPEESGDDVEDRVQDRDDLGSEAEDGEERLDGEENLGDEDDNQVEDLVEVTVGNNHAHHLIPFSQIDSFHAIRGSAHGTYP